MSLAITRIINSFKIINNLNVARRCVSTLYITGDRATATCALVTPQIDMEEQFKEMDGMKINIARRDYNVDVEKLADVWNFFSVLNNIKKQLECKRDMLQNALNEIGNKGNDKKANPDSEKLYIQLKFLRENIKDLKRGLSPIEENLMLNLLSLPNTVHDKTPNEKALEIDSFQKKPSLLSKKSHIDLGTEFGILKYLNPYYYYLKNDAALYELSAKFYFSECLRNCGFTQFSNPDFVKSPIIEGCGFDHTNSDEVFILHQKEDSFMNEMRLHLTGGGSMFSFVAFHARNLIQPTCFPIRYFCMGRQYKPVPEDSELGLFQVSQSSVVEIFVAVKNCDKELNVEIDKILNDVTEIYKKIGYHFKTCYCPIRELKRWESLKIKFEMYSPFLDKYVEVGNISVSDDYISRRLQFCSKGFYPKIISGTVLNVPKLLGCVIESDLENGLQLPNVFKDILQ